MTSGLYELAAVIAGVRCKRMTGGQGVVFAIAGFLFCVDVVIAVVTYVKSREMVALGVGLGNGAGVVPGVGISAMPGTVIDAYLRSADEIRTHLPVSAPPHARQPADVDASPASRHHPTTATREYAHMPSGPAARYRRVQYRCEPIVVA